MKTLADQPLSFFRPDPDQPRKEYPLADLTLLEESLFVKQLSPLLAFQDGKLIDGERRLRAALLKGRIKTLSVVVTDEPMTPSEVRAFQIASSVHRAELTPWEKFQACKELLAMNPEWRNGDLAKMLNLDASMITRIMAPSRTVAAVQEAFKAGLIGMSEVYVLSRAPTELEQHAMLAAKLNGATRDQLETTSRKARNSPNGAGQPVEQVMVIGIQKGPTSACKLGPPGFRGTLYDAKTRLVGLASDRAAW